MRSKTRYMFRLGLCFVSENTDHAVRLRACGNACWIVRAATSDAKTAINDHGLRATLVIVSVQAQCGPEWTCPKQLLFDCDSDASES